MSWFFRACRHLNRRDPRPLLTREYRRSGETWPALMTDERYLISMRYARSAESARALLDRYGSLDAVLMNVRPPRRKPPPRWRRLRRLIRRMFP